MNYKDISNKEHLIKFKNDILSDIDNILSTMIESPEKSDYKKAALLCYWFNDFKKYIEFEDTFTPKKLKRYERGDIIKVNFGFNVGDEHGGMHYAVVLDNNNFVNSGIITVVPLVSKKNDKKIHERDAYLGNEIYEKISGKCKTLRTSIQKRIHTLESFLSSENDAYNVNYNAESIRSELKKANKELSLLKKSEKELGQMKLGSVALVEQITAVSKMRIYDPKSKYDVLSGIKLSSDGLDLIDEKLQELFFKKTSVSFE